MTFSWSQSSKNKSLSKYLIFAVAIFCCTNFIDPPIALVLGLILSQTIGNPLGKYTRIAAQRLLQFSVVGLGFGMNLFEVVQISKEGFILTVCSILLTLLVGLVAGKVLAVNKKTCWLISLGTAICGGSAIAAISPILEAKEDEISIALGTIFTLNSIALFLFPLIGSYFQLTQAQFGLWAAIAIHDTSSVVGAAQKYGQVALQVATTVKLGRALWIIPFSLITSIVYGKKKWMYNFPFFIFLFIAATVAFTFIPQLHSAGPIIVVVAKRGLTLALFCIGLGLSNNLWKVSNPRPLLLGIILWLLISAVALYVVLQF